MVTRTGILWCAVATDDGYIVFGRCGRHRGEFDRRIHWVNKKGKLVHSLGGTGNLSFPRHMIRDSQGRVVVADTYYCNNSLRLIHVDRPFSHHLLTEKDGIKFPTCVCLDETTGRLLVGHRDYKGCVYLVSVYRWPFPDTSIPNKLKPVLSLKPDIDSEVSGLAVIGDCVCATGWFAPYLWINNMKTDKNKRHKLASFNPKGMTNVYRNPNDNNTLVVADHNKKLHFITICPQNMNITKHTVKNIMLQPRSIGSDPVTGKLVIAHDTDKEIVTCDNTGNIENKVTVNAPIDALRDAIATDGGYITLGTGFELGSVHWVNTEGRFTHSYIW